VRRSCLYVGQVRHRRFAPQPHAFAYPLHLLYLDLAELPEVFRGRWLWSAERPALARFHRGDHLGDPGVPLDEAVRDLVLERTGRKPRGPIRLLTQPRVAGIGFNPVSFYFCFDPGGEALETIIAEVENTPWGERHVYVLPAGSKPGRPSAQQHRHTKEFHVSPFLPMDLTYEWHFVGPGQRLAVYVEAQREGGRVFDATLTLERRELTGAALARALVTQPLQPLRVLSAIYWQALRLWWKGVPFHPHPGRSAQIPAPRVDGEALPR